MKKLVFSLLVFVLVAIACACGNTETISNESNEKKENIVKAPERDLAEGDYQDIGNGSLDLINESGSTAEGEDIVVYPDMDWEPYANVDYECMDMNGSVLTYIYFDGVEVDKQQIGDGLQTSISLDKKWMVTEGEHTVEAVQYADNDTSGEMIFYRLQKFTVKNK